MEVQRRFSSYHNGKRDIANFDEDARPMLKIVAREVANQQRRLGGDFAVAWAVVTRDAIGLRQGGVIDYCVHLEKNMPYM